MKPAKATLFCAIALIALGLWGALDGYPEINKTAFIPVGFGALLLPLIPGVAKENKVIAHIAVVLVLVILLALASMPFIKAIQRGDTLSIVRVGVMIVFCVLAMVSYVQSFIAARKSK